MLKDISPAHMIMDMAQDQLAKGKRIGIRIYGSDTWFEVSEFEFVDGTDEYVMTALADTRVEKPRLVFPASSFVAFRVDEDE